MPPPWCSARRGVGSGGSRAVRSGGTGRGDTESGQHRTGGFAQGGPRTSRGSSGIRSVTTINGLSANADDKGDKCHNNAWLCKPWLFWMMTSYVPQAG